jgi:hypothetical protein
MTFTPGSLSAIVIADNEGFSDWQQDCILEMQQAGVSVIHFYFLTTAQQKSARYIERFFLPLSLERKTALRSPLNQVQATAIATINEIQISADIILTFSSQSLSGSSTKARYGAWRFLFGNSERQEENKFYLGEMYADKYFSALSLIAEGDQNVLLRRIYFKTKLFSIRQNTQFALARTSVLIKQALQDIKNGVSFAELQNDSSEESSRKGFVFYFLLKVKLMLRKINHRINHLFFADKWNIGVASNNGYDVLKNSLPTPVTWMKEEHGVSFNADPFLFESGNELVIYFEFYDSQKAKGVIGKTVFRKDIFSDKQIVLDEQKHLSYPFLITVDDQSYCLPESSLQKKVALYRINKDSGRMEEEKILLDGFPAVDPTLLFYNDKWWLFCTSSVNKGADLDLYIFYSDQLTGKYISHIRNPVKSDIRSARPAGSFFTMNGKLYRPAQDSSETYGGSIVIQEVKKLNETEYEEETVNVIPPTENSRYSSGVHTFQVTPNWIVFDAKRKQFTLKKILRKTI